MRLAAYVAATPTRLFVRLTQNGEPVARAVVEVREAPDGGLWPPAKVIHVPALTPALVTLRAEVRAEGGGQARLIYCQVFAESTAGA